ncbi:MAG: hypothetical protein PVH18_04610 [Chloroflexota bacterium]
MNVLMIVLRVIHIGSAVFWVGVSFFNIQYLQPSVRATAPESMKLMQYLTQRTHFLNAVYGFATATMLSGLIMYWIIFGFRIAAMLQPYGLVLGIGAVAGIVAWVFAIFIVRNLFNQMGAINQAIQAQGGPPTPEQVEQLGALSARLDRLGHVALGFLAIAMIAMASAQYVSF